ncbi:putative nucleotide-binding protein [Agromyces cerinus]|uniref:TIR domain-containing protein n=1 Tax=Agromyces cerinus TaxID=33878 RepID=UPI00195E0CF2|nr:nucleotide-binding protein [Agromyces cerinus]MBM7830873.1 putative nucleotide-binding protein [Agromyces cerinus]
MDLTRKLELLDQQISDANGGYPEDFDKWLKRTDVVVRQIFGDDSPMYRSFTAIAFGPSIWFDGMDTSGYQPAGVTETVALLEAAKLEVEISEEASERPIPAADQSEASDRVFIVHGQDDARKFELSSFLQNLTGAQPVILHQQANKGQVLIEKFESSAASVGFAVVLLTGDDVGRPKSLDPEDDQSRARQNVVFEMGFFFGLLGRTRVAVLYDDGVELPSDINGIVYIPIDPAGGWKSKLAVELDGVDISVDWSAIGRS